MMNSTQASSTNQTVHNHFHTLENNPLDPHTYPKASVIEVIQAEHLDQNKTFLANITEEIIAKDGVWSAPICHGEYVRVEFERGLNASSGITIVARCLGQSTIEVYAKDNTTLLTTFQNITSEGRYQVFLTNLMGSQPTFDLRTSGDPVEYDYIVDPATGWVSPTGYADPSNQWSTEPKAYDGNTATYASYSGGAGWGGFLELTLTNAIYCNRVHVFSDFGYGVVDKVDIDISNSSTWIDKFNGTISDGAWTEINFNAETNVTKARFRYHYLVSGWIFWLYEFAFWQGSPLTLPNGTTFDASSIDETTAILMGNISNDGGEPCSYRFQYGLTTSYGSNTTWGGSETKNSDFGTMIHNLTFGGTYQYRVQVRNSIGTTNGSNKNFTTAVAALGWVTPTSHYDSNSKWDNEVNTYDDQLDTYAQSYHSVNDLNGQWSYFIYINHSTILCDKVRFYARGPTGDAVQIDQVDLDVKKGGVWVDVFNGSFSDKQWIEKKFVQGSVNSARIRFHVNTNNGGLYYQLYEVDFNKSRPVPMLINEGPTNRSWGVALRPLMNITVSNPDGASMTISWYSNSSGSWRLFGTNSSVSNGTYHWRNNNFSSNSTRYWWKIIVTDGTDTNASVYYFSTPDYIKPTSAVTAITPYWKKASPLTLTATASDTGGSGLKNVSLYCYNSSNNNTWYGPWKFGVITTPWSGISWSFTFPKGAGYYRFYSVAVDNATNVETFTGNDTRAGYDSVAPISLADTISLYWTKKSPLTITATASDGLSGVKNVTLYYRFSSTNTSWGGYVSAGVDTASPWSWSFSFSNGTGYYQFYSIAKDNATNAESAPGTPDTKCGYENVAPTSSISTISPYWKTTQPQQITILASDTGGSGLKNVTMYYYNSTNNITWKGPWKFGSTNTTPWITPLRWSFTFPNGTGYYRFYSVAYDNATNKESFTGNDTVCGYDVTAPSSSVNAIVLYWKNSSLLTIVATASDAVCGVKNVTLYYRFSFTNTSWGGYVSAGLDTASPWSWSFPFSNGTGYYQFYSIARDNLTNVESAPASADAFCGYDTGVPTSSVNAISPYWQKTSLLTITATANDGLSGVKNLTLWYRFSSNNASWEGWVNAGVDTASPWSWSFSFTNGTGYYQFYSIAKDNANNAESTPTGADTLSGYDNVQPSSSVIIPSPFWKNNAMTVTASANDATSGVKNVTLYYEFSVDNTTWGGSINAGADIAVPWGWTFSFANGSGYYRFYTIAQDNATNLEVRNGLGTTCGYDTTLPSSSVLAILPYWKKTSPITITATANDTYSGMKNVTLYYRYSSNNASWGGYMSAGVDTTSPWSWNFAFANGSGYYQLYSLARDNTTNVESNPWRADASCGYDTIAPSSSVTMISPYWKNTTSTTINATASDALSGVKNVTLWYRFSNNNASWDGWMDGGVDTVSPWSWNFTFSNGTGYYQFYSIAVDNAMNTESASGSADTPCGYDNVAPTSSLNTITPYWKISSPVVVSATASDTLSGVKNVTLYYRFSSDNSSWGGWVSASVDSASPWNWSFGFTNGSGYYQFYSIAKDNATTPESAPGTADTNCGYDSIAPSSSVDAISPYWKQSAATISATTSDILSGVKNITLCYRFSNNNASWGGWASIGVDTLAPWSWNFGFSNGTGYYQFYSIAKDNATNVENTPGGADANCGYDTVAPISSVDAISPYWKNASAIIRGSANDPLSGIKNVTLYYRFSSTNASWDGWVSAGVDLASPWSWSFSFANGTGYYQFYSIAIDNAMNTESAPGKADACCGYDTMAPSSSVDAIAPYWKNLTAIITASASDTLSGVKNVTLYYRFSSTNTSWGGYVSAGVDTVSPWSWVFSFSNGTGYYQFYSVAKDNATNIESPPGSSDAQCGYDVIKPSSSITSISPYWTNTGTTITVTAGDSISGVKNVSLYYRFSSDNASWSGWVSRGVDEVSPWSWSVTFVNGTGYYQFYSIAKDNATNTESAPGSADAGCGYDTIAPSSSVDAVTPYWKKSAITITATASDTLSGVKNMTLYYRFCNDNATWGGWVNGGTDGGSPWSWNFGFLNGSGFYQFYSIAIDNSTNRETTPGSADSWCGYDNLIPSSSIDAISDYWKTTSPFTITASANDTGMSGLKNVALYYRYRPANASGWGSYVSYGVDPNPWSTCSWDFTFQNGSGHYEFYSIAVDNATNTEAAPGSNGDTECGFSNGVPFSQVNTISPYWTSVTPLSIIATADDDGPSGLKNVSLYYYHSVDNLTWSGPWDFGSDDDPWIACRWDFRFPNETGWYRFFSIAVDNSSSKESAPFVNDTCCGFDDQSPTCVITYNSSATSFKSNDSLRINAVFSELHSGINESSVMIRIQTKGDGGLTNHSMTMIDNTHWYYDWIIPNGSDDDGLFNVSIYSSDRAHNPLFPYPTVDSSKEIDNTPPSISSVAVNNIFYSSATIDWVTNENASSTVEYGFTSAYGSSCNTLGYVTTHSCILTGLSSYSTYHYCVVSYDLAGNRNVSSDYTFITASELQKGKKLVHGKLNNPPSPPTIDGPTIDRKATEYTYRVQSIDPDNDTINYTFDWGDTVIVSSGFIPSGTPCMKNHRWMSAGKYFLRVTASDNQSSAWSEEIIWIDALPLEDLGYFLDTNSDGLFDVFHSNASGNETTVEMKDGVYLIDADGNHVWDHEYNTTSGVLTLWYQFNVINEKQFLSPLWVGGVSLFVIAVLIIIFSLRRFIHKSKKK